MATVAPRRQRVPLTPWTMAHFKEYSKRIVLDNGANWELEDFQEEVVEPILAGVKEVWTVIPEGNGKTTLMGGVALYHSDFTRAPWVPIAASSRDQAEILARQAYQMIRSSPGFLDRFKIYEGYREIRNLRTGGRGIKVYAADTASGDGVIPTLGLCDEGHRWPHLGVYRLWKGKLNKRGGQIVMISTAGAPGEEFEEQRDAIRSAATTRTFGYNGAHVKSTSKNIVMNEWRVADPRLITDMKAVKDANPFSGITEETLLDDYESPTTDLGDWKRLKPLSVDTPLPTPGGWTTMLEIEAGDQVLNGEGLPTTVRAATPVQLDEGFEVEFSDGAKIVATADHLWEVEDSRNHHRIVLKTTQELAEGLYMKDGRGRQYARWRVRLVGRKVSPETDLRIDPYVLGVWLGDGTCDLGRITSSDPEVWAEIEVRGYSLGNIPPSRGAHNRVQTLLGLQPVLRRLGLLGNKHIPSMFLLASEEERWELLQGLVDSDGTVVDGRVMFWNMNARLVADVRRLVWSLGLACIQREDRALLNGVDYGPRFCLEIPCDSRHPVARLPRKLERVRTKGKTCDYRRIRTIVPVGETLVRCIAVDAEDSIFLAGEAMVPTHNCNIPSRSSNAAITESEWDKAGRGHDYADIPEGEHVDLGADVAWKHDTFALVPLWRAPEFFLLGNPIILTPPRDGSMLSVDDVKRAFETINERTPIDSVVIDMERAEDIAQWLEDELNIEVVDRPQGNANQIEDYDAFMKNLRADSLKHCNDNEFRKHVMNAIARLLPSEKKRFDRPSQSRAKRKQVVRVIDALTAAGMVNQYAGEFHPETPLVGWR